MFVVAHLLHILWQKLEKYVNLFNMLRVIFFFLLLKVFIVTEKCFDYRIFLEKRSN